MTSNETKKTSLLEKFSKAPQSGILYALCRDKVIFQSIEDEEDRDKNMKKLAPGASDNDGKREPVEGLLELHIFDENTEYRYVKRSGIDDIEEVINAEEWKEKSDDIYPENIYVSPLDPDNSEEFSGGDQITVVNYIQYKENGMIQIVNYRYRTEQNTKTQGEKKQ